MTFDPAKYLRRIGIEQNEPPSVDFLRKLHYAHLLNIPFENLSIHINEEIILEPDDLYSKVVIRNRGGFCYELNYLFFTLLKSIGFDAKIISSRVFDDKTKYGAEFDHMSILVRLGEKELLCDVGFGDSFTQPLEFVLNKPQKDRNYYYKISRYDEIYFLLSRSGDLYDWENLYLFSDKPRTIDEYRAMCLYHQTSPESSFTRKRVCTRLTGNGRITLTDKKLIITKGINRNEIPIEQETDFANYLKEKFDIVL